MTEFYLSEATKLFGRFQRDEIDANTMSKTLRPVVHQICRNVASKFARRGIQGSVENLADDVTQDVMFHLLTDSKRLFSSNRPIEPFILQIARRKVYNEYLDVATVLIDQTSSQLNDELDHDAFHDSDTEYKFDFEGEVDRQHAREKIRQVMLQSRNEKPENDKMIVDDVLHADGPPLKVDMRFKIEDASEIRAQPTPPIVRKSRRSPETGQVIKPQYKLNSDQERLAKIMTMLYYTQEQFASRLGIAKPTLASYLYGRTDSVPEHVMQAAEMALSDTGRLEAIEVFQSRTMPEIMAGWLSQLGRDIKLSKENMKFLCEILDLNMITLERWANLGVRPKPGKFLEYEDAVKARCKRTKRTKTAS